MRTLFYYTAPVWSGAARAFSVAARGLAARGEPVTVVCCADSPAEQVFAGQGLDVVPLAVSGAVSRDAWRLRAVLKERFIEVVFLHSEREQLVASSAMRLAGRGAVIRRVPVGGGAGAGRAAGMAGRMAVSRLLFSTGQDRERAGIRSESFVAPLGVDVERADTMRAAARDSLGVGDETQLIVCVADRKARGRITTALRVAGLLADRHPDLRVALMGSGCDDDDTHMHAAALGVTPMVSFLGERDDAPSVVAAADVGWVAAEGDDGAFACLDFMAARVPVIAERSPIVATYVPDGIAGVLLPRASANDTAAAVASFLADAGQRAAMGKAGRTRVARDFTESAMIDGFATAATAAGDRSLWTTR